ncbi:hypothetical protein CCUS01_12344 [Colletotrichum cuscutae]|uniref:Uncharacterized protein n=1 Tax=Colletotrichum cuscutae TaxID=1209917 RepID=A0AAI9XGG6_9PEZI|nr:hypothetical protein CCUS01_12344 [Colletotrichum cuscutae]
MSVPVTLYYRNTTGYGGMTNIPKISTLPSKYLPLMKPDSTVGDVHPGLSMLAFLFTSDPSNFKSSQQLSSTTFRAANNIVEATVAVTHVRAFLLQVNPLAQVLILPKNCRQTLTSTDISIFIFKTSRFSSLLSIGGLEDELLKSALPSSCSFLSLNRRGLTSFLLDVRIENEVGGGEHSKPYNSGVSANLAWEPIDKFRTSIPPFTSFLARRSASKLELAAQK